MGTSLFPVPHNVPGNKMRRRKSSLTRRLSREQQRACCYDNSPCFDVGTFGCSKRGLDSENTSYPLICLSRTLFPDTGSSARKSKSGICLSHDFGEQ
jgi:hypothetical protein